VSRTASNEGVAIRVVGAVKSYGRKQVLRSVSLSISHGESLAIIGPNGAGKTTLVEIMMGLQHADEGSILVLGNDMDEHPERVQKRLGVQLQDAALLPRASVREYLRLFAALYDRDLDIPTFARTIDMADRLDKRVGHLSGGERQRLTLGMALIGDPQIVFLDEPTTGLDPIARRKLWAIIGWLREQGRTIVLVTHYMEEVEKLCDRVAVVVDGSIIALGTPSEVVKAVPRPSGFVGDDNLDSVYELLVSSTGIAA